MAAEAGKALSSKDAKARGAARFLFSVLSFAMAPAGIGIGLRVFGHLTLRASLGWAMLCYPLILVAAVILGVSVMFRPAAGSLMPEEPRPITEAEAENVQDPIIG
ncbi:hypothetical protein V5F77_13530 [Xanthobacter sp. DSM 24535]|uniref:hypothetical protein n=1 Tax=Roseixanthobacter psychrophilus TaxID=3119917 RepID=UPI0037271FA3